jgi:hypothetical protein
MRCDVTRDASFLYTEMRSRHTSSEAALDAAVDSVGASGVHTRRGRDVDEDNDDNDEDDDDDIDTTLSSSEAVRMARRKRELRNVPLVRWGVSGRRRGEENDGDVTHNRRSSAISVHI